MGDGNVQYFEWVEYPHTRLRVEIDKLEGIPSRFVVQLERRVDESWRQVVRFDHDPDNPMGHDITEEGIHMDVSRDGTKIRITDDFPPVDLTRASRYCIAYIERHAGMLLRRFEKWHDLNQDPMHGTSR